MPRRRVKAVKAFNESSWWVIYATPLVTITFPCLNEKHADHIIHALLYKG